ncbi:MAG: GNAT family N-acetyltransferase [Nocardioides sp.]
MTSIQVVHGTVVVDGHSEHGESWRQAAMRLVGGDAVMARDLSGEPRRFEVDPDLRVALRPMTRGDLPDVVRWRQAPHVARWWQGDDPATLDSVTAKYGPDIDRSTPTRQWVWEVNGRSIGMVQDYRLGDYPEFPVVGAGPDALGVDYLIGEAGFCGRGLGTACLWAWAVLTRQRFPDVDTFFAAPDHRNGASLRMLAKSGFTPGVWFDEPQDDGSVDTLIGCSLDVGVVLG